MNKYKNEYRMNMNIDDNNIRYIYDNIRNRRNI